MKSRNTAISLLLVLSTLVGSACSGGGDITMSDPAVDAETATTSVPPQGDDTTTDPGKIEDYSKDLPASVDYGYLTATLVSAGLSTKDPATYDVSVELEPGEALAVLEVEMLNQTEEYTWTVPHNALFNLDVGDVPYDAVSAGSFALEGSAKDTQKVVFVVPEKSKLNDAVLRLQENARDPDTKTAPATIAIDGTTRGEFKAIETTEIVGGTLRLINDGGTDCGTVVVSKVIIDDSMGFKENGAVLPNQLPKGLARPPVDHLYAIVIGSATKPTGACGLAIEAARPILSDPDGQDVEPIAFDAVSVNNWGVEPKPDVWIFPIPKDQRELTFTVISKHVYSASLAG